jgi:hypothetical protein
MSTLLFGYKVEIKQKSNNTGRQQSINAIKQKTCQSPIRVKINNAFR